LLKTFFYADLSLLEEFGLTSEYLPCKKNVVADALSLLEIDSMKIQKEIKRHLYLSQNQKTLASVISNQQSQCILP
jgi:hypothetical protein